jgi:hypothetical protein
MEHHEAEFKMKSTSGQNCNLWENNPVEFFDLTLKVAAIVNDMSEVNVDAQFMKNGSASLSRVDERLVEMQNG